MSFSSYNKYFSAGLIFLFSFFSFTFSMRPFNTTDSYPNNLVALSWLFNRRLDLTYLYEELKLRGIEKIAVVNNQGVVYPKTPIILGILNIPGFSFLNKIYGISNLSSFEMVFSDYSQYAGKYLASFYCAASAAFLFLIALNIFNQYYSSLVTTGTYVFATNVFNTASQANWQHGISLFFITLMILLILKNNKKLWSFLLVGAIFQLLIQIRISNIFYLPLVMLALFDTLNPFKYNRKKIAFFITGLLIIFLPIFLLNNLLKVPYGYQDALYLGIKKISLFKAVGAIFSILFSINVGLFTFSPVLLLGLLSIKKILQKGKKNQAMILLKYSLPTLLIFILFCGIWPYWTGGTSLGARMLTETVPIWCLLVGLLMYLSKKHIYKILFIFLFITSFLINILTTFMIDGWWFDLYTKQTIESQFTDAWYDKPSLFEYLLKTRIIYFADFKKDGNLITSTLWMKRPTFKDKRIVDVYQKKSIILDVSNAKR